MRLVLNLPPVVYRSGPHAIIMSHPGGLSICASWRGISEHRPGGACYWWPGRVTLSVGAGSLDHGKVPLQLLSKADPLQPPPQRSEVPRVQKKDHAAAVFLER